MTVCMYEQQQAQLMVTNAGDTFRGQSSQTWYNSICYIWFPSSVL